MFSKYDHYIQHVRTAPRWLLWVEAVVVALTAPLGLFVFGPSHTFDFIGTLSSGWIPPQNIALLLVFSVRVPLVLSLWGRMSSHDLGFTPRGLKGGFGLLLALYLLIHIVDAVWIISAGDRPSLDFSLFHPRPGSPITYIWWMTLFVALEEGIFRGFYCTQYTHSARKRGHSRTRAIVNGILFSSLLFCALHFWRSANDIYSSWVDAFFVYSNTLIVGIALGVLYAISNNIWIVVAAHVSANAPLSIWTDSRLQTHTEIVSICLPVAAIVLVLLSSRMRMGAGAA
ncbi:MAG TPA: CPBP family intramembrane glutamic endopeptidase [Candidatus Paceibacterota bacterium]|nr:CPBP family intramembrane glutamic endopeptidase [Candidatus Paceibacterota bacterium]